MELAYTLLVISLSLICIVPIVIGAPFVASSDTAVKRMVAFAKPKKGEKMIDIGSGDGKILIAFAKEGVEAHGYEINPLLVLWSKWIIWRVGLSDRALVHFGSFWNKDISPYDIITVYGISYMMKKLEKKLRKEAKPSARIVANLCFFPSWKPEKDEVGVRLYKPAFAKHED